MSNLTIKGIIEWISKGKGLKKTQQDLKKTEQQARRTGVAMKKTAGAASGLGRQLMAFVGVAVITRLVGGAIKSFAAFERAMNGVERQLGEMGLAVEDESQRIRDFLREIEATTGTLRQDLIPQFQKLMGVTGDVDAAMVALGISNDIYNQGIGNIKQNSALLAAVMSGKAKGAALKLGVETNNLNGSLKTNLQILEELIQKNEGFAQSQTDAQSDLEANTAAWNEFKMEVGAGLAILTKVGGIFPFIVKSAKTAVVFLGQGAVTLVEGFSSVGRVLGRVFDFKRLLAGPADFLSSIKAQIKTENRNMLLTQSAFAEEYAAIWTKEGVKAEVDRAKGVAALRDVANRAQLKKELEENRLIAEEKALAEIDAHKTGTLARMEAELHLLDVQEKIAIDEANEEGRSIAGIRERYDSDRRAQISKQNDFIIKLDEDNAKKLAKGRIAAAVKGSQEELDLKLEALELERRLAEKQARETGASLGVIEQTFFLARLALLQDFNDARFEQEQEMLLRLMDAQLEADESMADLRLSRIREGSEEAFNLERAIAELRTEAEIQDLEAKREREITDAEEKGEETAEIKDFWDKKIATAARKLVKVLEDIDKEEVLSKREKGMAIASMAIAASTAIFGDNKASAIASAIMSTFVSANKAMELGPIAGPIMAAVMIAMGLANVNKIRKTDFSSGSGFDDPVNDALARKGGRRWATDLMRELDTGFREEFNDGSGPSTTSIDQSDHSDRRTSTIHIEHFVGGRSGLRKLQRMQQRQEIRDRSRFLR